MIKGIDISTHQKNVNYKKLKEEGIDFAIIRCGYGKEKSQKDSMFETHYKGLKEAGIKVGTYLFSYCSSVENSFKEAENCLYFIKDKDFDLPVFLDLEDRITRVLGKDKITQIALNFCKTIESHGFKAGVYANLDWFNNLIDVNSLICEGFKIWLAQWNVEKPTANFPYQFWQFTNKLNVASLKIDGNYCEDKEIIANNQTIIKPSKENNSISDETIELLAIKVINGVFGNGIERKNALGDKYNIVQQRVNQILINNDFEAIAKNVIKGIYGNGETRRKILGILYKNVQEKVNQILSK